MSLLDQAVGEIAAKTPGATEVFFRHHINFCCHGGMTLSEAIAQKNLDAEAIENELGLILARNQQDAEFDHQSNQEIIDHILARFHQVHREQLPELQRLAARVESVHRDHPACPLGLADHLTYIEGALLQHMQKEESILFPMLAQGINPLMVSGPIHVMRAEHEEHIAQIEKIYQLTGDLVLPEGACNTWQALYTVLQAFISDLNQHIHMENDILFTRTQ